MAVSRYPSDEGKGIIRVDGLVRNNAIGDTVVVRKLKAIPAEKVIVTPLEPIPSIDERYLAGALENVPLIKDDNVMVPLFGRRLSFQVIDVTPASDQEESLIVTSHTTFQIIEAKENTFLKPSNGIILNDEHDVQRGTTNDIDLLSKLERLADLKDKGILTQQELEQVKSQVLARILPDTRGQRYNNGQVYTDTSLVYEDLKYGIKIRYPNICEGLELDSPFEEGVVRIVQFVWRGVVLLQSIY